LPGVTLHFTVRRHALLMRQPDVTLAMRSRALAFMLRWSTEPTFSVMCLRIRREIFSRPHAWLRRRSIDAAGGLGCASQSVFHLAVAMFDQYLRKCVLPIALRYFSSSHRLVIDCFASAVAATPSHPPTSSKCVLSSAVARRAHFPFRLSCRAA
jgi:hypothetical protein